MKKIKYLLLGLIVLCIFVLIKVEASDIVISGNSVFRKNEIEASISFKANDNLVFVSPETSDGTTIVNGYIYYISNERSSSNKDEILTLIDEDGITMNKNGTVSVDISLSSGAKYTHIVVKDNLNNYSNILTVSMPNDLYYFDDFESYNNDSYPNYFKIKHNGSNSSLQKVITHNSNKVLNAYGVYAKGLDERIQIEPVSTGYLVLEADIFASDIPNDVNFGGLVIGENYNSDDRNIIVVAHRTSKKFIGGSHTSNITFEANKTYHVKIITDVTNKKFDYYINGTKVNTESINAMISFDQTPWFGIYNGEGTIFYDNIKFYSQDTDPRLHLIKKGTEANGNAFTIDKTTAKKEEIVTITPTPTTGYKVVSVKINDNESGITNNFTNYTFEMLDEDVEVTVEFEKIIYEVTNGGGQIHTIGKTEDAIFRINADKSLLSKVYLNNEELFSEFYEITEGSTIITLKQEFINNLLPGTYDLMAIFSDGGEARTTIIIKMPVEKNPKTGDSILLLIIIGSISLISAISVFPIKKRFN